MRVLKIGATSCHSRGHPSWAFASYTVFKKIEAAIIVLSVAFCHLDSTTGRQKKLVLALVQYSVIVKQSQLRQVIENLWKDVCSDFKTYVLCTSMSACGSFISTSFY